MFVVDTRKKYKIVADILSGMWVKWIPGQFLDSQKWGRYTFIDNPFRHNPDAKRRMKQVMTEWILALFPDECMTVRTSVSGEGCVLMSDERSPAVSGSDRTSSDAPLS